MMECAIPMCGNEDDKDEILIPCCENGHFMHRSCMMAVKDQLCPLCRSGVVKAMMQSSTLPLSVLCQTPYSFLGAAVAVYVGKLEHDRITGMRQRVIII